MNTTVPEAVGLSFAMALVILFCRAFPFLFSPLFPKDKTPEAKTPGNAAGAFFNFVERAAPPAAMTVLAFNALGPSVKTLLSAVCRAASSAMLSAVPSAMPAEELFRAAAVIAAVTLTAFTHIWKRNSLISIFGGTAAYMILDRIIARRF